MSYEKKGIETAIFEKIMNTAFELMNYLQAQILSYWTSLGWGE